MICSLSATQDPLLVHDTRKIITVLHDPATALHSCPNEFVSQTSIPYLEQF